MKIIGFIIIVLLAATTFAESNLPDLAKIKIAAEAGDAEAQDKLAERYIAHMDTAQAIVWYRKAAAQNYVHAQGRLGNLLLMRFEMHTDAKPEARAAVGVEAHKWIVLAANAGDTQAEADLAGLYLKGSLVKQDFVEAYKWGELASRGSPFAPSAYAGKSVRDAAILKLDTAQINEAQKRVNSFVPKTSSKPKSG